MASSKKIIEIRGQEITAQGGQTKQVPSAALPPEEKEFLRQFGKHTYDLHESLRTLSSRIEKSGKDWEKINDSLGHLAANWVNPAELEKERQRREEANLGISAYSGAPGRSPKYASEADRQRQEAEFDKSFGTGSAPTQEVSGFVDKLQQRLEELAQGLKGATGGIGLFGKMAGAAAKALGGSGGGGGGISGGFGGGISGIGGGGMSFKGGGLTGALGGAMGAIAKFGIYGFLASKAVGALTSAFDKAKEVITNWSGAVASAQAAAEARRVQDLADIAQRKGGEFAEIINSSANFQSAIRDLSAEFLDALSEPFELIANALTIVIRLLSFILSVFNAVMDLLVTTFIWIVEQVNKIIELLTFGLISLDKIYQAGKKFVGIVGKAGQAPMQERIDDLFGSAGFSKKP
jgi:hypothetical protein